MGKTANRIGALGVLAAAACVGTWRHAEPGGLLARPEGLAAALTRLTGRALGRPADVPADVEEVLIDELLDRHDHSVGFGVSAHRYR